MSVSAKCPKCGSEDLEIGLSGGEAEDDSPVTCKGCSAQWTFEEHKQRLVDGAAEEIRKMLGEFKL